MAVWEQPQILSGISGQVGGGEGAKPELGLCIIHQGIVTTEWAIRYKNLQIPTYAYMLNSSQPYDTGREGVTRGVLSHGVKWVFHLDSVPNYTPILIRDPITHNIDVKPISEIGLFNGNGLERIDPVHPYEVFEKDRWCKIKKVIRHPFDGSLKRISCIDGFIDITPNHSIYKYGTGNGEILADAGNLEIGKHLIFPRLEKWERGRTDRGLFFPGNDELAWLYGFMVAEGSVSSRMYDISISNDNEEFLEKSKEILESNYNVKTTMLTGRKYTSKIEITNKKLAHYLHNLFYTDNRDKRIPASILNAPEKIIHPFLQGFLDGDGHINKQGTKGYFNNSQSVALGILFLLRRLRHNYSVHTRDDKPKAISIFENVRTDYWYKKMLKLRERAFSIRDEKGWGARKISREIGIGESTINGWLHKEKIPKRTTIPHEIKNTSDIYYKGYVYDLATETQRFSAGVGPNLVHNTDVLIPINTIPLMIQWAEQFNLPLLSGLYWAKKPKAATGGIPMPAAWIKVAEKPEENKMEFAALNVIPHLAQLPNKSPLVRCDVVGAGCLLIKADIFKKLDESNPNLPYFEWGLGRRDPTGKPLLQLSEDFFFCMRCVKELDINPHVAVVIQCDHICNAVKRGSDGEFELLVLRG